MINIYLIKSNDKEKKSSVHCCDVGNNCISIFYQLITCTKHNNLCEINKSINVKPTTCQG